MPQSHETRTFINGAKTSSRAVGDGSHDGLCKCYLNIFEFMNVNKKFVIAACVINSFMFKPTKYAFWWKNIIFAFVKSNGYFSDVL